MTPRRANIRGKVEGDSFVMGCLNEGTNNGCIMYAFTHTTSLDHELQQEHGPNENTSTMAFTNNEDHNIAGNDRTLVQANRIDTTSAHKESRTVNGRAS